MILQKSYVLLAADKDPMLYDINISCGPRVCI